MTKRVALAYSGGLDTSVAVAWMRIEHGYETVAVIVDVGQEADFDVLGARAKAAGAVEVVVVDAREELLADIAMPTLAANALYEGRYPLISALSRPVIVRHLVAAARLHGATAVAHGATGKGNDQVRFEVGTRALAPELEILAPVRVWGMSREQTIDYAEKHDIAVTVKRDRIYSIDSNLWGRVELVEKLGAVAGSVGFGRVDIVEGRRVGIKSREVYEAPAALALIMAHADLEGLTLEHDVAHEKARLEPRFAEVVYDGMWFSPLRQALSAFMASTQKSVTGEVRIRFSPGGGAEVVGRRSPVGLYVYDLATYDAADAFKHEDAEGFVRLFGLGIQTWAARQGGAE